MHVFFLKGRIVHVAQLCALSLVLVFHLSILLPAHAQSPQADAPVTSVDEPLRMPVIVSATHPDPSMWYATSSGLFSWTLPVGTEKVAVEVSTTSLMEPMTSFDPPIDDIYLSDFETGVYYLHVQFKDAIGWGETAHREIRVDLDAPEAPQIDIEVGSDPSLFPVLTFLSHDEHSGILGYEVIVADRPPVRLNPVEASRGYRLYELEDGTYTATVRAYDRAGNRSETSVPISVTAGWTKDESAFSSSVLLPLSGSTLLTPALLIIICVLVAYIVHERKENARREMKLRREALEIKVQMEKIFSALRDEIYVQINALGKKKRLTKNERAVVESLESALSVSETILEKEVDDVTDMLK